MKKADKIPLILETLQALYPEPEIPLNSSSPFTHLVAVLLSAQCTDARVNTVTPTLFDQADTASSMTEVSVRTIADIIRPCGPAAAQVAGHSRPVADPGRSVRRPGTCRYGRTRIPTRRRT